MTAAQPTTKILVLAANPTNLPHLRLDEEIREIERGLRATRQRDRFTLVPRMATRAEDLRRAMLEVEPRIVHFCGHGTASSGVVLEDRDGRAMSAPPEALADLFNLFSNQVDCVLLNACHSEPQALAIARHIPYVIGMSTAIGDQAAIKFSVAFYDALGAGRPVEFAYRYGCNAIALENLPEHLTPVLKLGPPPGKRGGADFRMLGKMGRDEIETMLKQYKAAVAADADDGDAHLGLGLVYLQLGMHELAIRHFRSAIDLCPEMADAYFYCALGLIRGRRPKTLAMQEVRAIEAHLTTARQLDPQQAKYDYLLAIIRYDYYLCNGLSSPPPTWQDLLLTARGKEHDAWEVERLLRAVTLRDPRLVAAIRGDPSAG